MQNLRPTKEQLEKAREKYLSKDSITKEDILQYLDEISPAFDKNECEKIYNEILEKNPYLKNQVCHFTSLALMLYEMIETLIYEDDVIFPEAIKILGAYYNIDSDKIKKLIFNNEYFISLVKSEEDEKFSIHGLSNYPVMVIKSKGRVKVIKRITALNTFKKFIHEKIKAKFNKEDALEIINYLEEKFA